MANGQQPSDPRPSTPEGSPSGQRLFHGVRMRSWGRWVSEIRIPNSRDKIWLGSYDTPEQAARAYDVASLLLCSPFPLNFSDSPSLLHLPRRLSATSSLPSRRSIQVTAHHVALISAPGSLSAASTGCATFDNPYSNLGYARADFNSSAYLQEDSSWMQEVLSVLASENPDKVNRVSSTGNIGAAASLSFHGVLDAATISLSPFAAASCSAAAGAELQDEVLTKTLEQEQEEVHEHLTMNYSSWEEYYIEEGLQEMLAVDGLIATSAAVTTRQRIDVDDDDVAPSDIGPSIEHMEHMDMDPALIIEHMDPALIIEHIEHMDPTIIAFSPMLCVWVAPGRSMCL